MIAPLRRAHAWIWSILALLLPLLLFSGLTARKDRTPINPHLNWERLR